METKQQDEKFFGRGNPAMDVEVAYSEGSFIYDTSGKKYIDFSGGAGVGILGWRKEEIEFAIRQETRPTYVYPNFYYSKWSELAERLAEILPGNLQKTYRATGGSEAVEAALEMAMMYTGRKKFVSVEGAYHGNTIGALSIGATAKKEKFPNLLQNCEKIEPPLTSEALEKVEKFLSTREVAAVIMEPVVVNLGVVIPEEDFMTGLQELCRKHGSLLIMDEAITGFGRTGKMFATEHYDIEPDILCMAKGITAGHAAMGAVATTAEIDDKIGGKIGLYSSYGWHPIAVDASLASLDYLRKNKEDIISNIEKLNRIFEEEVPKLNFKCKVELRTKGLAIGIDLKDEDYASDVKKKALKAGLLMNTEGSSLVFLPNFLMDEETVKDGLRILETCI